MTTSHGDTLRIKQWKPMKMNHFTIHSHADADRLLEEVRTSAARSHQWLLSQREDPFDLFRQIKFEKVGVHPLEGHPLNLVEQINQTWTYVAAIVAARKLIDLHPDVEGFKLAPGAHASLELDIMSNAEGIVGAETFAAVTPKNNGKLNDDLKKMAGRSEQYRYVFFMSPLFPGTMLLPQFSRDGIGVWSIDVG